MSEPALKKQAVEQMTLTDDLRTPEKSDVIENITIGLSNVPTEVLWMILQEAAISSTLADIDADFQDVLTSLSRVCTRWSEVVNNTVFRKRFISELIVKEPLQSLRRKAFAVRLTSPLIDFSTPLDILGDELFVVEQEEEEKEDFTGTRSARIAAYDLGSLDMSKVKRKGKKVELKRLQRQFNLPTMKRIHSLQANELNGCLYTICIAANNRPPEIYRIDAEDGRVLAHWTLDAGSLLDGVHVCHSTGNVVVPVRGLDWSRIVDFDADGHRMRTIELKPRSFHGGLRISVVSRSTSQYVIDYCSEAPDSTLLTCVRVTVDCRGSEYFKQTVLAVRRMNFVLAMSDGWIDIRFLRPKLLMSSLQLSFGAVRVEPDLRPGRPVELVSDVRINGHLTVYWLFDRSRRCRLLVAKPGGVLELYDLQRDDLGY